MSLLEYFMHVVIATTLVAGTVGFFCAVSFSFAVFCEILQKISEASVYHWIATIAISTTAGIGVLV